MPFLIFFSVAAPKSAAYVGARNQTVVYARVGSKEHEPGICATVCRDITNNKTLHHSFVSKMGFIDKLYDPEYTGSKDIVFLQMSLPGRHFEHFDQEASGIIITLNAFLQMMKFFKTLFQTAEENIELLKAKFVPDQQTMVVLSPEISFVGEGYSVYSFMVESQKNYDLVLDCVWWSEGDLKYAYLTYKFRHPSIHSETPFYLPVDVILNLANRSMDALMGVLRHVFPPPSHPFLIRYCSKEPTQPIVSSPLAAVQQSTKSSSSSPKHAKPSSGSSSSRSRHESPPRKKNR